MKLKHIITAALSALMLSAWAPALAQSSERTGNIVERIEADTEGAVTFDIPDQIVRLMFAKPRTNQRNDRRPGLHKVSGWRIQVFSDGRNPQSLQARASARGNAIGARFPKYRGQIYSFSRSPNWYTRVGNFTSQREAAAALAELKRAFPSFASEMRIVQSAIIVIK